MMELFTGYQQSHSMLLSITFVGSYDRKYAGMLLPLFSDTLFLCCLIEYWLQLFLVIQKGNFLELYAILSSKSK